MCLQEADSKQHQYQHQHLQLQLQLQSWCPLQTAIVAGTVDTTPRSSNVSSTATASFPHRRAVAADDAAAAAAYDRPESPEANTA